jgi:hypothetical protein
MNATNLANGFAVEEKKPGTSGGIKSTVISENYAKSSKWAGGASTGKPPTSTLGMAGNSIMRSSTDKINFGNSSALNNNSSS